jgi:hypothetical protein
MSSHHKKPSHKQQHVPTKKTKPEEKPKPAPEPEKQQQQIITESQDEEEFTSFRKRELVSNWGKYDMPVTDDDEVETVDFNQLLQLSCKLISLL